MKKLMLLFVFAPLASAQTTPNIHLNIPANGATNWGALVNANMTTLDNYLGGVTALPNGFTVTGNITAGGFTGNLNGTATGLSVSIAQSQVTNLVADLAAKAAAATSVQNTLTVNLKALTGNIVISASDLTTGTLPHGQLPPLVSGDIPNNAANTSGTAAGLTGTPDVTVGAITASGPFSLSNTSTLLSLGTASVSQNFVSNSQVFSASYWNGSAAITASLQQFLWIGTGTNPAVLEEHDFPAGLNTNTVLYRINPATLATSGANIACPKFKLRGAYWTGSVSGLEDWDFTCILGTGANPTDTLLFTHTGSTGAAQVSMPGLIVTGTPLFESGSASNSDISGELTFSGTTTASYTFANTYVSHPECWAENQFSTTVARWITYTSTTSMTINFASGVTGTVSYGCVGRN